jgi:hypothetical protein|tara:strand:- start:119 stop:652 length:534 start_codon:yes stop_codon:yes gene_type:complete
MTVRRTSKGKVIDIDAMIKSQEDNIAVGNMNVNARGDKLGPGGQVIQTAEERVREEYENNPPAQTMDNVSLKGNQPTKVDFDPGTSNLDPTPKTAKTAEAEQRAVERKQKEQKKEEVSIKPDTVETPAPQYADREATTTIDTTPKKKEPKFKEVELPNGDFEMIPIDEWEDDETSSN